MRIFVIFLLSLIIPMLTSCSPTRGMTNYFNANRGQFVRARDLMEADAPRLSVIRRNSVTTRDGQIDLPPKLLDAQRWQEYEGLLKRLGLIEITNSAGQTRLVTRADSIETGYLYVKDRPRDLPLCEQPLDSCVPRTKGAAGYRLIEPGWYTYLEIRE